MGRDVEDALRAAPHVHEVAAAMHVEQLEGAHGVEAEREDVCILGRNPGLVVVDDYGVRYDS